MTSSKSRKRKHHQQPAAGYRHDGPSDEAQIDYLLYIQAHEADLVRGQSENASALEASHGGEPSSRLVKLHWPAEEGDADVWVDRFDARLLLDGPFTTDPPIPALDPLPPSPTGSGAWSDLPSDAEDTFFFGPGEDLEDYRTEKRRKLLERNREERLKALHVEDPIDEVEEWGGSDEEPDIAELELMRRTATHIASSPNAAQLEMRIMANHGGDRRFAFLRGRWKCAWDVEKRRARAEILRGAAGGPSVNAASSKAKNASNGGAGLGGLAGYGESDEESDGQGITSPPGPNGAPPPAVGDEEVKEAAQEARRRRAREWAEMRRMAKALERSDRTD